MPLPKFIPVLDNEISSFRTGIKGRSNWSRLPAFSKLQMLASNKMRLSDLIFSSVLFQNEIHKIVIQTHIHLG